MLWESSRWCPWFSEKRSVSGSIKVERSFLASNDTFGRRTLLLRLACCESCTYSYSTIVFYLDELPSMIAFSHSFLRASLNTYRFLLWLIRTLWLKEFDILDFRFLSGLYCILLSVLTEILHSESSNCLRMGKVVFIDPLDVYTAF